MALKTYNNTQKGKFKPPRYKAFGLDDGVPFERAYRTLKQAEKLAEKRSITQLHIYSLS